MSTRRRPALLERPGTSAAARRALGAAAAFAVGACRGAGDAPTELGPQAREAAAHAAAPATSQTEPTSAVLDAGRADDGAAAPPAGIFGFKRILHVGDSMVGYTQGLQLELKKRFDEKGIAYESHTVTSGGFQHFAAKKLLAKWVDTAKPDLVIVQVGNNNLTAGTPPKFVPYIHDLLAQTGGVPCYWIGVIPLEQKEYGMSKLLAKESAPCTYFESMGLKLDRQSDKIHPTQIGARKWANAFLAFAETTPPGRVDPASLLPKDDAGLVGIRR